MTVSSSRDQTGLSSYRKIKDLTAALPITGRRSYRTPVHGYFRGYGLYIYVLGFTGEYLFVDSICDICNQRQDSMNLIAVRSSLMLLCAFVNDFMWTSQARIQLERFLGQPVAYNLVSRGYK